LNKQNYIEKNEEEFERRRRLILDVMGEKTYIPMKEKELAILLDIPREKRRELREVLESLLADGLISASKKGKLGRPEVFSETGIFTGHPKGFGFVKVEGRSDDVFISRENVKDAMHGDRVRITVEEEKAGRRAEGKVLAVLEHANRELVGLYEKNGSFGFVIPDNPKISRDIFIPKGSDLGAVTGHKVMVRIRDFGGFGKSPEGTVTEILGHIHDPGVDILSVVKAWGLPEEFPEAVLKEVEAIPDTVQEEERAGRKDLREIPTVTIDGEEAKDLDDAITLESVGDGYRLGVHIADVSHYVREGSALDREALRRGTSVYLTDRVIPMLPHRLSNGICSLNQGEDRLALSCLMEIDSQGNIVGHEIAKTLICVDRRLTYTTVNGILTGSDPAAMEKYEDVSELLFRMEKLSGMLREKRYSRGAIDFDFPESKIILDAQGRPQEIRPYERNAATRLIEDFMLAANETVAEDYYWQEMPFLYRTHEKPDEEKMVRLGTFLGNFGYTVRMPGGQVHPGELQKLLTRIQGTPEEAMISRITLRSMKQARYTPFNTGHFGLAARYYTHFTSPIRRYPDLQIHRIIKECLAGEMTKTRVAHYEKCLPEVAVQASALERRADEAERETDRMKKVQYMERFVGEEFDGVISGVTGWGFYVELPNTVEGLVPMSELREDYFVFDESHFQLIGEMTRKTYKLGQPVRVLLTGCDRVAKTIDFAPVRTDL
jgi:ribonuclease R